MTTRVLDPATLAAALTHLTKELELGDAWQPTVHEQVTFLSWYRQHGPDAERLRDLKSKASGDVAVLNQFLTDNGFEPMFNALAPGGIGVAAIIDMLVRWAVKAKADTIRVNGSETRAFTVPGDGVLIYQDGDTRVACVYTEDNGCMWLVMPDEEPADELSLLKLATEITARATCHALDYDYGYTGVTVPTIEIDTRPDISWMVGMFAGRHRIDDAFQAVKLRINEHGARIKATTGLGVRGSTPIDEPLVFNRPFIGWFTQPNSTLPICVFYADTDCWKKPAGTLEDL